MGAEITFGRSDDRVDGHLLDREHDRRGRPLNTDPRPPLRPVAPEAREPVLDVLRGVAILGILPVNIQLMRGPDVYLAFAGAAPPPATGADGIVSFAIGWLVAGKFIASFALLFGIGAAIVADRARARGRRPGPLLARRFAWLVGFGLVHMLLLFPGDILFVYGLTGLLLLTFLDVPAHGRRRWAVGLIGLYAVLTVAGAVSEAAFGAQGAPGADAIMAGVRDVVEAYTAGGPVQVLEANVWQAIIVQSSQLIAIPWILGLFLLGMNVAQAGWVAEPRAHRHELHRVAVIGLVVGLPANLAVGAVGPLGLDGADDQPIVAALGALGSAIGAPILAVGYLAAIASLCLRAGSSRWLAATGRMALTGYLLQSAVAAVVFVGLSRYGELGLVGSLPVVLGIWAVVLLACPAWLSRHPMGPVEALWRRLTYGRALGAPPHPEPPRGPLRPGPER